MVVRQRGCDASSSGIDGCMTDQLKAKVVRGVGWSTVQAWSTRLISFFVYPILARLLGPESSGLIALAGVYIPPPSRRWSLTPWRSSSSTDASGWSLWI
jgi:hypothetical protein